MTETARSRSFDRAAQEYERGRTGYPEALLDWFATDAAVAEIARVLRPRGVLVLVWNEPSPSLRSPLPEGYRRRFSELHGRRPDDQEESNRLAPIERGPFGPIEGGFVEHEQVNDRDGIVAFAASMSWIVHRPQPEREAILGELAGLLPPGEYTFPMRAEVTWAVRS